MQTLHLTWRWGEPSQTFVRTLVRSLAVGTTVACIDLVEGCSDGGTDITVLDRGMGWLPGRIRRPIRRYRLAAVADAAQPDLIHQHFRYKMQPAVELARDRDLPLVVAVHGHDVLHGDNPDRARRWLPAADLVLVPSRWLGERVESLGIAAERIEVANAGIPIDAHPFRERRPTTVPTVGFVGRYVEKKGADHLIEALGRISRDRDVRAVLVGHGPLEPALRAAAARVGLDATFVDGTDPAAVAAAWERMDVVATPSRTATDGDAETLCYVNLEAQARGIPVVTADHGGIPEGVDPDAAVIVAEGDLDALADGLAAVLGDQGRWAEMGRAGRRSVERRYAAGACAREMEARYRRLVAGRTSGQSRAAISSASSPARTSKV